MSIREYVKDLIKEYRQKEIKIKELKEIYELRQAKRSN